jgi:hypothetical protein
MEDITHEELWAISDGLNDKVSGKNPKVQHYIDSLWSRLVSEKKLDIVCDIQKKTAEIDWQQVDMNSIKNEDVREAGTEWLCLQTLRKLNIDNYLSSRG